jgi:predicted transcriptional regulator
MSKFKEYLENRNESMAEFHRRTGISFAVILKMVRGQKVRTDTAKKVIKASKKQLTLEDIPIVLFKE